MASKNTEKMALGAKNIKFLIAGLLVMVAGFLLQHHRADLGSVAVPDGQEIAAFYQVIKLLASLFDIGHLFGVGSLLTAAKQCVAAKGDHCNFFHYG